MFISPQTSPNLQMEVGLNRMKCNPILTESFQRKLQLLIASTLFIWGPGIISIEKKCQQICSKIKENIKQQLHN
jgi:hypothetical protein